MITLDLVLFVLFWYALVAYLGHLAFKLLSTKETEAKARVVTHRFDTRTRHLRIVR